jgi:hypothetical protein
MPKDGSGEYLKTEEWPFLISHFGKKVERPPDAEILRQSLQMLVTTFNAPHERGYYQGAESYEKWIAGLRNDALWDERSPKDDFYRRAGVNECTLRSLIDERRCAAVYLAEQRQTELAELYRNISESAGAFYAKWLDKWDTLDHGAQWRAEETLMLEAALASERRCVDTAKAVLNSNVAPPVSPRIVHRGEITVTGLRGDGLQTAEVWNSFDAAYKEKPFTRANSGGWEVRFYDGERPAAPGADVHVGYETLGSAPGDGYTAVTLPASDYVVFDVLVRDGYESRNSVMNTWLADNAGIYAQRTSDGTYYAVERYGERFKGDAPDSVAEIWIPIVRLSEA